MNPEPSEYICICCFSKAEDFVKLLNCKHTSFFDDIIIKDIKLMDFSICSLCHLFLKKVQQFKQQIIINLDIMTDPLQGINVIRIPKILRLKQSNVQTLSCTPPVPMVMPVITSVMSYNTQVNEMQVVAKEQPVAVNRDNTPNSRIFNSNGQLIRVPRSYGQRAIAMPLQSMAESSGNTPGTRVFNTNNRQLRVPNRIGHSSQEISSSNKFVTNKGHYVRMSGQREINAKLPRVSNMGITHIIPRMTQSNVGKKLELLHRLGINQIDQKSSGYRQSAQINSNNVPNNRGQLSTSGFGVQSISALSRSTNRIEEPIEITNKIKIEDDSETESDDGHDIQIVENSDTESDAGKHSYCKKARRSNFQDSDLNLNLRTTKSNYEGFSAYEKLCAAPSSKVKVKVEIDKVDVKVKKNTRKNLQSKFDDLNLNLFFYGGKISATTLSEEALESEREAARQSEAYQTLPHKCESCVVAFKFEQGLKRHNDLRHKPIPKGITCNICKAVVKNEDCYMRHLKRHLKRYNCLACEQQFLLLKLARTHYHKMHSEEFDRERKCVKCAYRTKSYSDYRKHLNIHRVYICKKCGKKCFTIADYQAHVKLVHDTIYNCELCSKVFKRLHLLKSHQRSVHDRGGSEPERSYYCVPCDKFFTQEYLYAKHQQTHAPDYIKKYECHDCGRRFGGKHEIERHIMFFHLKNSPYKCEHCGKVFITPNSLKLHVTHVHEKKRYPKNKICQYCGKRCSTKTELTTHIRTHTGERPLQCDLCPATFGHGSARYNHRRLVHKVTKQAKTR